MTGRLTEHKYQGSYEQVARAIVRFAVDPGLDLINFSEQLVFSFLTGNADLHLKNFSLINKPKIGHSLSPAYDMVATALIVKGDHEELALNLNGKKRKLKSQDFQTFFKLLKIDFKSTENILRRFKLALPAWEELVRRSFLPENMKEEYILLVRDRGSRILDQSLADR